MSDKIQVVLVDDHPLFRQGVASVLGAEPDIEVVGQGATADDAVRLARDLLPDIIMLDIDMPEHGLNAARIIANECPVVKIIILTVSEEDDHLVAALKAGARAYVLKGVAASELVGILRAVWAGQSYVPPILAASLILEMSEAASREPLPASPLDELTERERQILEQLAAGLSNKEIGQQLHLTEKTVRHYMTNILQKLQVRNRVEAALIAQKDNWISAKVTNLPVGRRPARLS
ncbi:MAG: response regulator transcription factor [Anaerolineae bacterium]|nr:response regulator transcription factor [Anaerolineales bacterium]MCQ3973185.1 DNA-binding response regulator [Anaerolineae bacterium]